MAKPNDFFVGIIDLFAILLPGGVLTFTLVAEYPAFFDDVVSLSGGQGWVAFLFGSYLLGHIVFMVGAKLDDLYDIQRRKNDPYTNESAYKCATRIKDSLLAKDEIDSVNTYHWSISFLTTHHPEAMVEINRLVADSKFFRSLVVILPIVSLIFLASGLYWHAAIFLVLIVPCYLRYYGRRLKSTTRAYQYIVILNGLGEIPSSDD